MNRVAWVPNLFIEQNLHELIKSFLNCSDMYFCPQCGFRSMLFMYDVFECKNYPDCGLEIEYAGGDKELKEWQDKVSDSLRHGKLYLHIGCLNGHYSNPQSTNN